MAFGASNVVGGFLVTDRMLEMFKKRPDPGATRMSKADWIGAAYLVCAILFIIGLKRLSSPATARSGNRIAAVGMAFAIVATLCRRARSRATPGSSSAR